MNYSLTRREQYLANILAKGIVVLIAILFYILAFLFKLLFRLKRWLFRLLLLILAIYLPLTLSNQIAYAPKANATLNGYSSVEKPLTEKDRIINYINEVFGKDADKAFLLLTSDTCAENRTLDPKAMHDNEKWGQGKGKDWGIFQINDHWQGVTNVAFLTDWKINIQMAYNIYSRDGHSFKLWTCGRKLGI